MKPQEEPIHIKCNKDDIADVVIMPGDPLRAKYIAENFLTDAKEVTSVRNMLGFTGTYKGKRVTVMGHGMGMPSVSIYSWELFYFFDVKKIIRIGTAGVVSPSVEVPEVVLADQIYTESNFAFQYDGYKEKTVKPSTLLNDRILEVAKQKNMKIHVGTIMTTDVFGPYVDIDAILNRIPKDIEPLAEEMEAFGLIHVANSFGREATCMVTAVDSKFSDVVISIEARQTALNDMIILALDSLVI
ncbi:MAG: purine-nucleoside phosphorylase [Bacilli bacterium]